MSKELADRLEQWLKWTILNRQEKQLLNEAIAALRSEPVAWTAHGIKREDTCIWMQDSDGTWNTSCGKVFEFTNAGPAENEANFCYHCGGALLPEPYSDDAAPSRESRTDRQEPGLSAEQVEAKFDANDAPSPKYVEHIRFEGRDCVVLSPEGYEYLYSTALSSLRGTFADGIEAAAREIEILILPRSDDKDPDDELFFMFCEQGAKKLRELAQDQRESSELRTEASRSLGSNPAPMHGQSKTGPTGSHPGAPTKDADELLREARDILYNPYTAAGQSETYRRIDAHLSRKEQ